MIRRRRVVIGVAVVVVVLVVLVVFVRIEHRSMQMVAFKAADVTFRIGVHMQARELRGHQAQASEPTQP